MTIQIATEPFERTFPNFLKFVIVFLCKELGTALIENVYRLKFTKSEHLTQTTTWQTVVH